MRTSVCSLLKSWMENGNKVKGIALVVYPRRDRNVCSPSFLLVGNRPHPTQPVFPMPWMRSSTHSFMWLSFSESAFSRVYAQTKSRELSIYRCRFSLFSLLRFFFSFRGRCFCPFSVSLPFFHLSLSFCPFLFVLLTTS